MSRLRRLLIDQYTKHYTRVNLSVEPTALKPRSRKRMQLMYGELIDLLPKGSRVLDLGCGTGVLLYWLSTYAGIIPVGVDSSVTQVDAARQRLPGIGVFCEDGLNYLRKHPSTFAGIFCLDVLEHIPGDDLCLEWIEAARAALRSGGFFYCRVPNAANLTGNYSRYMDLTHERIFTSTSILQLLDVSGLQDCRIVPIRAAHLSGRLRLMTEWLLHKIIFQIAGRGMVHVFTRNVCAVGFRGKQ